MVNEKDTIRQMTLIFDYILISELNFTKYSTEFIRLPAINQVRRDV